MNRWAMIGMMLLLLMGVVYASDVSTDRLNFYESEQHKVNITNTEGSPMNASSVMPTGFSFVSSASGCTNPSGQIVNCTNIADGTDVEFIMSSPASGTEYSLHTMTTTLGGSSLNDVDFIYIRDDEILHTLVEYGRGRGNYFYDSLGRATSAGVGTGYNYVPVNTSFELNYLHKVYNIKQYFNLASSRATNVEFTCVYPYHTVVRSHLTQSITDDSTDWTVSYLLPRIDGSWERMGFLGMDFDPGEYSVDDIFTINCTNLRYTLSDAHGDVVVDEDSFSMEVRSPDPIVVFVSSDTAEIGNGTSEVAVSFAILNNESYPMDKTVIEIASPENAQWIGVRGEIWGSARDRFRYELTTMEAGQTESLTLIARFDTTSSSDTTLLLSEGINVQFVPTWELNAYNPMTYIQKISVSQTQSVNYATTSTIKSLQDQMDRIEENTIVINTTVNLIESLIQEINTTTYRTETSLLSINQTLSSQMTSNFNSLSGDISSLGTQVANFETTVHNLVNCTANAGSPICSRLDFLNTSIGTMQADLLSINTTLSSQLDGLEDQFSTIYGNFTATNELITSINATLHANILAINSSLDAHMVDIESDINDVFLAVGDIETLLLEINTSIQGLSGMNMTVITEGFSTLDEYLGDILVELDYMQGFNEELIFLVTDSVGLATASQEQYVMGNTETAMNMLSQANEKLVSASTIIEEEKKPVMNKIKLEQAGFFGRIWYSVKGWFI